VIWGAFRARSYLFAAAPAARLWPLVRRSRAYYAEGGVFFLINHGDQALVGALLTPAGLAGYYLARRIPDALALILLSVEEVMGPTLARATAGPRADLHRMFRGFTIITAAFVLPAAMIAAAFAWAFIALVGQDTYGGVTPAIVVLSLGLLVQGAMTLVAQSALALGHPRDRLKLTALCGALLVAFTAATAPLGLTAVALGRVAALAVATLAGAYLLRHLLPPIPWADVLKLGGPAILAGAAAVGLSRLAPDLRLVPVYVIVALAVFAIATLGVLSRNDRAELAQVWRAG
jgi:O-antigen/teichoic acid export membrane protein